MDEPYKKLLLQIEYLKELITKRDDENINEFIYRLDKEKSSVISNVWM